MTDFPIVTPEFMAGYDHATPSGHANPACKLNRLANIGIDTRARDDQMIDLDLLTDRSYTHICETSDDGWLIGGGDMTKLKRPDTAHAEVWRFGPDTEEAGGIPFETVDAIMREIRFGPLVMHPTRVNLTPSNELELLLKYDPASTLGTLFGLLADVLACPCGDYGNPFHITLVRGVKFRSDADKAAYFEKVDAVTQSWQQEFPDGVLFGDGGIDLYANREEILFHYPPTLESGVQADIEALRKMR